MPPSIPAAAQTQHYSELLQCCCFHYPDAAYLTIQSSRLQFRHILVFSCLFKAQFKQFSEHARIITPRLAFLVVHCISYIRAALVPIMPSSVSIVSLWTAIMTILIDIYFITTMHKIGVMMMGKMTDSPPRKVKEIILEVEGKTKMSNIAEYLL